ncbi:MAG: N(4)-(beta-N-acetylglucosaminyl)-L-asparaginase [Fimbriimonadaceae bacterium]|nr:N(4)-(beta-N-acetylglucosaminyl)-L-asparaginase [Fimbriimonadaceae bacterium]
MGVTRREALAGGVALATGAWGAPSLWLPSRQAAPVVVASANGLTSKNGGTVSCVETAFNLMVSGGDVLDALVEGVAIVESDPEDTSVGYGGLPNAEGTVQLDAAVMHGTRKTAGGVACLEGVRTPAKVASAVMLSTDHHLLVGEGAQKFARQMGFQVEDDLNTERSRKAWLEWKRRSDPEHFPDPRKRGGTEVAMEMAREGWFPIEHVFGTIHANAVGPDGSIAAVTTTSGLAFKIPGRVGDSPILGAGLYADGNVGAAGSTGRGEANLFGLCSFLIVEEMRRGSSPLDAGVFALRRVAEKTEARLKRPDASLAFGLQFYVLDKSGRFAGVSTNPGSFAVCDESGPRLAALEVVR